jgi:hypothetical protein
MWVYFVLNNSLKIRKMCAKHEISGNDNTKLEADYNWGMGATSNSTPSAFLSLSNLRITV